MKKALLLGAMAFLAINIATVQNVNAQHKIVKQSADEQKIEKEKAAAQAAAQSAKTEATFQDLNATQKQPAAVDPKAANNTQEVTSGTAERKTSAEVIGVTGKPKKGLKPSPAVMKNSSVTGVERPASSLKPKAPTNPKNAHKISSAKKDDKK